MMATFRLLSSLLLTSWLVVGCSISAVPSQAATATTVMVSGSLQVRTGSSAQYTASIAGASTGLVWEVNGKIGGSSTLGTISSTGVYTAPSVMPANTSVEIVAASQPNTKYFGLLGISLLNPLPLVQSSTLVGTPQGYTVSVLGSGFVPGAQIAIQGSSVATVYVSPTSLTASLPLSLPSRTTQIGITVTNPAPGSATSAPFSASVQSTQATLRAAARLLDQSSFGTTSSSIAAVAQSGLPAYLQQQFSLAPTLLPLIPANAWPGCANNASLCLQSDWWQAALTAPDQLRQRVAFALNEIFVVAEGVVDPRAIVAFQNVLATDAFGNFSTLLHDVAVSPAMGSYLNMLNSGKPAAGEIANENFARESMQLFTMGNSLLNEDGSLQLDSNGNPVPPYTEANVEAFARAYTGWTYATASGGVPSQYPNRVPNFVAPMVAVESEHDQSAKTLLNGTVLPSGQSAEQDLADSLQNTFNHPNVGPFISRQLIEHLVMSNPSSGYVSRVAAVFADDGTGVRGNMQAIITAILMDQEARAPDSDATIDGGHLREPILWMTAVLRGLGFTNKDALAGKDVVTNASYSSIAGYAALLNQMPFAEPSVFSFFSPNYVIPGSALHAPEFGLENTASVNMRLAMADTLVMNEIPNFNVDLSATSSLGTLASSPAALVSSLGTLFMDNYVPDALSSEIISNLRSISNPAERARVAVYLMITSSEYKIEH